jgi:hypothetical protein
MLLLEFNQHDVAMWQIMPFGPILRAVLTRVVQKNSIFFYSAIYLPFDRVFNAESKYRRKKTPISGSRTASLLAFLMEKRMESGASSGLVPGFFRVVINSYLKALRIINLRTRISKNPGFQLVPPI